MANEKKLRVFFAVIVLFMGALCEDGLADAGRIIEAQNRQSQAMRDYYQGLKQLGPNATPDQKNSVFSKTVRPAQIALTNSYNQTLSDRMMSIRHNVFLILKEKAGESKLPRWLLNPFMQANAPVGKSLLDSEPGTPNEPGLDGSVVPKEIEFPTKPKKRSI